MPEIRGVIKPDVSGSIITITMKMDFTVIVFMIVWLGAAGVILVKLFIDVFEGSTPDISLLFGSGGMFLFGYCLMTLAFKYESNISKDFFLELTEGYIDE